MRAIIKVLTARWFLLGIAFVMLTLVVWWGGPYLAFGEARPFETDLQRLLGILWLAVLFILAEVLRRFRVNRASNQLASDMSKQGAPANQPPAEALQLRARFDEAIAALRASKGKAFNLYELPWYIIIGPPGVGKTTVIANSGLNFPLAKKFGSQALRGVGGTRNCDWWFTDEAVLLDTAGRYTTQDSDANSDQLGWTEFLSLLTKHRGRRPINGVMVAMSAPDLLSQSESERSRHVQAVRDRLEELGRELKIDLPVYLLLTKLDLISGFTEFFDDLNQEHRSQVWGLTFRLEISRSGQGPAQLPDEFDLLLERLNGRLMLRMEGERDVRRRALLFTFPRQFAALRRNLTDFVGATFSGEGAARKLQLRGVYFTSGTQEGTPMDRMIGALARTFGLNMRSVPSQQSQGRAYFIQRLLREVLFKESGLAGINRRIELQQGILNIGVYAAVVLVLVIGLVGFSVSYGNNRNYLGTLQEPVSQLEKLGQIKKDMPLVAGLERLDAYAEAAKAAERYRDGVPLGLRWGLYQGRSIGNAARDAYQAQLNAVLLPAVAEHLRDRLITLASEPDKLYEYLKAYLMLGQPQNREPNLLIYIGELEWSSLFADDPGTFERFNTHYRALIADADHMQPAQMDTETIERARNSLAQVSPQVLMYSRLKSSYAGDKRSLNIAGEMPLGGERVFVRRSGASLSDPFPAMYTKALFKEISGVGRADLVAQFVRENWVMGSDFAGVRNASELTTKLMQLYEEDYIRAWDQLLNDFALSADTQGDAQQWGLLAAPTSPLKRLLQLVREHTFLADPQQQQGKAQAAIQNAIKSAQGILGPAAKPQLRPGEAVTRYFTPLHRLAEGAAPAIDATLPFFAAIQAAINDVNSGGGSAAAQNVLSASNRMRQQIRTLPPPIPNIFAGPPGPVVRRDVPPGTGPGPGQVVPPGGPRAPAPPEASPEIGILRDEIMPEYKKVVTECRALAQGRYPLVSNGVDMTLADFARLFGPNGTFDQFYRGFLQKLIDTSESRWRWRPDLRGIGSEGIPRQFQTVEDIRRLYFPSGSEPRVGFSVSTESTESVIQRYTLTIDDQKYEFRNGPNDKATPMKWPGAVGGADFSMVMPGSNPSVPGESGPWAMFRFFESKTTDFQQRGPNKFVAIFTLNSFSARVLITADSSLNPFGKSNKIRNFNCQG
jgi:type VI secretion system protein ImpL